MPTRHSRTTGAKPSRSPNRVQSPIAVIDIGSNSGRVTVMRLQANGHLDVLADARMPLRLAREVDEAGQLGTGAVERTLAALHDFRAVALGAGATSILAVATSAVREAQNGDDLVLRARQQLGIKLVVIDGAREAAFAFLGAVHGLPVDHGLLLDLGGGSLEVSHFRDRKLRKTWTLPLGALRLSYHFLRTDPPGNAEIARLRKYVVKALKRAGVPRLAKDEALIGTGGTIRNIAKIEAWSHREVLPHVHGSVVLRTRVQALARRTNRLRQSSRAGIHGLNKDRSDSFHGGLLAVTTCMQFLRADSIQVSGQGLREGIALATLGKGPMPPAAVRLASIEALCRRFGTFRPDTAHRRSQVARRLLDILEPKASDELREILRHACFVLDIGRAMDYYERHRNAAVMVAAADLQGFSQRGIALLFAVLMHAADAADRIRALRPMLNDTDDAMIERAATLLLLADEIERRSLPGQAVAMRSRLTAQALELRCDALAGWRPRSLADRFARVFARELVIVID